MFDAHTSNKSESIDEALPSLSVNRLLALDQITVCHPDFQNAIDAVQRCLKSFRSAGEPICVSILAEAGCGKTHLANRFLNLHPTTRKNGILIKPVVRVRVPSGPTVKGLSTAILNEFGDPLCGRGSEQDMAIRITRYLRDCGTRLVIVEELQHFIDEESEKRNIKLANWVKLRIEESRVSFVLEGLPRVKILFDQDKQLRDRFDGPIYLRPFHWFIVRNQQIEIDSKPFRSYLHKLYLAMPFKDCIDFGARNIAFRMFYISNGVPRPIGKLLKEAAIIACRNKSETIDLNILSEAHSNRLGYRPDDKDNPFSDDFDVDDQEAKLQSHFTKHSIRKQIMPGEGLIKS